MQNEVSATGEGEGLKKLAFVVVRIVRARVPKKLLARSTTLVISGDGWRGSSRQRRGW